MGACLGRMLSLLVDHFSYRPYQRHTNVPTQEEEQAESPVSFELIEDSDWTGQSSSYTRLSPKALPSTSCGLDNPIQMLDARNLLIHQGCISTAPLSSVDLGWEHEEMPIPQVDSVALEIPEESTSDTTAHNSQPSSLTASPWSRVSSPNSLEWDPEESEIVCGDVETESLLTEIERITDRTLKETGEWTSTS